MATSPPRRKPSPAVFRRRRIVLVSAVLIVVAAVWLLVAQPWKSWSFENAAPAPSASSTTSTATDLPVPTEETPEPEETAVEDEEPEPEPEESATTAPGATPCAASALRVEAVLDAETYPSGQNPQLGISLTNGGATDCSLNVGTTTQSFTISSGDDVWWRSTDCQTKPSDMVVLLAAGQTVTSAEPVTWDRTRSAVGTCKESNRPVAPGGGASYHLRVEIGGVPSTETTQFLLY